DAERAIHAALAIQQPAQKLAISIGINTGIAYCVRAGTATGVEAQLMGPMVNLAARLRNRAGSGEILVGSAAYRPTRGVFDFAGLELTLPGLARPVGAYQVLRMRSHVTKSRGIAGLQAPLVGRDEEMAQLKASTAQVLAGKGQLILLSGDAGLGKSRLVTELKADWEEKFGYSRLLVDLSFGPAPALLPASAWLEGHCQELASAAAYWPFVDMLRHALSETDGDGEPALSRRLVATLETLAARGDLTAAQVAQIGPVLGHLLSLRFGSNWDEGLHQIDPKQLRQRIFAAMQQFVIGLARRGPLALVFEDLHWCDALSLDLIGQLMEVLASAPVLLVCIYRPEQAQAGEPLLALAQQRCPDRCTALHLQELTVAQSRQLLAALPASEKLSEQVRAVILAKAQGNPFFLEEFAWAQLDGGPLFRQDDSWRPRVETAAVTAPETVQSVILSRVDRLPPELKQLLQVAAVASQRWQFRLLAALTPTDLDLGQALAALSSSAFLYAEHSGPEAEYAFRHVLVQEAVYQALPGKRRAPLHQQVAEAVEALHAGNLEPYIEQLAYHYDRSNDAQKAIEYLIRAGDKARQACFSDEAVNLYQRALARLDALAPDGWAAADRWRLAALKGLGVVYSNTSRLDIADDYFHRAIALAHLIDAPRIELVQMYAWLCRDLRWQNRLDEVIRIGQEGLAPLDEAEAGMEAAILYGNLAEAYFYMDDRPRYHDIVQRMAHLLTRLPYSDDLFASYGCVQLMHRERNELEKALKLVRTIEQGLQDGHNPLCSAWIHMWQIPRCLEAAGDMRSALSHTETGFEQARQLGDAKTVGWGLNHLAERFLALGELARAQATVEEGLALHQRLGLDGELMESTHILATIRYCQGAVAESVKLIEIALELARRTGYNYARAFQRTLLGRGLLAQGQRQEAQVQFCHVLENEVPDLRRSPWLLSSLAGLEATAGDPGAFQAYCRDLQRRRPELAQLVLERWWLEPVATDTGLPCDALVGLEAEIEGGRWEWIDPFGDCAYTLADGLVIRAANCRNLWANNLSAPRLVRPATGDFAVQATCRAALPDRPAIGGLLLWQDKTNYLRLTWGELGGDQVAFAGSRDNSNLVIGRGRLPNQGCVMLRLERRAAAVCAFVSADGQEWLGVGQTHLPADGPLLVGLHAIGQIDRIVWPDAYPEGTAIRFAV
ncbi:MAG: AAA family ATPase, partial [Caldilineaceae bacterium]|nr:AAA family ATPase [Caldilineaceae bacterium]